jgi:hypothetical protein
MENYKEINPQEYIKSILDKENFLTPKVIKSNNRETMEKMLKRFGASFEEDRFTKENNEWLHTSLKR